MIPLAGYDYVDFGCSSGGSMVFANRHLGGKRGLGVDVNPAKVKATRQAGFQAIEGDLARKAAFNGSVRFSILSHFLEHLPNHELAVACLDTSLTISRDFVYIQQPWFDADEHLNKQGLKLYWSDWHGHPNHMTSSAFLEAIEELRSDHQLSQVIIGGRKRIKSSDDPIVHPIDSPRDQHQYDAKRHPPKPSRVTWDFPIYRELVVILVKAKLPKQDLMRMLRTKEVLHIREYEPLPFDHQTS